MFYKASKLNSVENCMLIKPKNIFSHRYRFTVFSYESIKDYYAYTCIIYYDEVANLSFLTPLQAVANESGINFISVKGPELLNMVRIQIVLINKLAFYTRLCYQHFLQGRLFEHNIFFLSRTVLLFQWGLENKYFFQSSPI